MFHPLEKIQRVTLKLYASFAFNILDSVVTLLIYFLFCSSRPDSIEQEQNEPTQIVGDVAKEL
jgi:hypothetical protein